MPIKQLEQTINTQHIQFENATYNPSTKVMSGVPKYGALSNYPVENLSTRTLVNYKDGIVIIELVIDKDTGNQIGFLGYTAQGQKVQAWKNYLDNFKGLCCNFTYRDGVITDKLGIPFTQANFDTTLLKNPRKIAVINSKKGEKIEIDVEQNEDELAEMDVTYLQAGSEARNTATFKSAQTKWLQAKANLKKVSQYYYTCLQAIESKGNVYPVSVPFDTENKELSAEEKLFLETQITTLAVSEDSLYWCIDFVEKMDVAELTFILIHEMLHIISQHAIRFRTKPRNHTVWNIACDLYINTYICRVFGCEPGGGEVDVTDSEGRPTGGKIKTPDGGVFLGGKMYAEQEENMSVLDISTDTPEKIYERIMEDNPQGILETDEDSDGLFGEHPDIIVNPNLPQSTGGGGGSNSLVASKIMDMGKKIQDVMVTLLDEQTKIRNLASSKALEAIKIRESAGN